MVLFIHKFKDVKDERPDEHFSCDDVRPDVDINSKNLT